MSILTKASIYPLHVLEHRNEFVSDTPYMTTDCVEDVTKRNPTSYLLQAHRLDLRLCVDFWATPNEYELAKRAAMKHLNRHIYSDVFETLDEVRYIIRHGNTATALKLLDELDSRLREV